MDLNQALYLVDVVDNINIACIILFALSIFIIMTSSIGYLNSLNTESDHSRKFWGEVIKKWWIVIIVLMFSLPFPTKRTMYLMLGDIYLRQDNVPEKVRELLELKLDECIKELRENKEEEPKI